MKKPFLLTAAFGLFLSSTALASDEPSSALTTAEQQHSAQQLTDAIKQRQYYYLKNKIRDNAYKNQRNQRFRHVISRAQAGTNGVSTDGIRTGELDSPFYSKRRANTNTAITAPNNAKRNFRVRAYDYYVDGGVAGTDVLESEVIKSSEHRAPSRYWFHRKNNQANVADVISDIRSEQRNRTVSTKVPTGYQSTTFRRGDSSRNFLHPYMDFNIQN